MTNSLKFEFSTKWVQWSGSVVSLKFVTNHINIIKKDNNWPNFFPIPFLVLFPVRRFYSDGLVCIGVWLVLKLPKILISRFWFYSEVVSTRLVDVRSCFWAAFLSVLCSSCVQWWRWLWYNRNWWCEIWPSYVAPVKIFVLFFVLRSEHKTEHSISKNLWK